MTLRDEAVTPFRMNRGLYETMLIIDPSLPDTELAAVLARVTKILTLSEGSRVVREDKWGIRDLAYPINKHQKGYYILITHELLRTEIQNLRPELRLVSGVIRFMTVTASVKKDPAKTKTTQPVGLAPRAKAEEPGASPEAA